MHRLHWWEKRIKIFSCTCQAPPKTGRGFSCIIQIMAIQSAMSPETKVHSQTINIIRIISILAVVMIHTTTRTIEASNNNLQSIPWTLFLNQISRFAVPMFFLVSGFVLELNYHSNSNYVSYLKKRLSRIFVPYLAWSAFYYYLIYRQHTISYFSSLLAGNSSYQLYFIPTLLIFYLIFPFLHHLYRYLSKWPIIIILGTIQLYLLYRDYYLNSLSLFYPFAIACLNFYFFLVGIIASHHELLLISFFRKTKIITSITCLALAFYVFYEGGHRYLVSHNYLSFYSQWRPSIFFYTLLLAMSLFYFGNKIKPMALIKTLSDLSFFVFFVHVSVLELVWNNFFRIISPLSTQIWFDPLFFLLTATTSFFLARIIHQNRLLTKLFG